jgi:hypothetical protein
LGIDPARARALSLATDSHPIPASAAREEFQGSAVSDDDTLAGRFAEKIGKLAQRYEDGHEPDFDRASLAELLAWCLARSGCGPGRPA